MEQPKRFKLTSTTGKLLLVFLFPALAHASFIESTIGTAVVNDAAAANYNPAALVLLKNAQIIPLGTLAYYRSRFSGSSTRVSTGVTDSGSSSSYSHYSSASFYAGTPITDKLAIGLAILSNDANRNAENNAVLRYVQASNTIQDYDVIPAVGYKINDKFSLGAGINFSYAKFDLRPITGFPGTNIADSESNNRADGSGIGVDAGFLLRPGDKTLIGFNYRSMTTYRLSGKSVYEGTSSLTSNNYHYKLWTPARSTFSINQFVTAKLGFITTIQRIQWSSLSNVHVYNIATLFGTTPVIANGIIPYRLHDTWALTLGTHYRLTPRWILRVAGTYNQSPGNPHYQVVNGDAIIAGASTSYDINKTFTIDGSYAHGFIKNQNIETSGSRFIINGVNEGSRDAVSLKLTVNI